ncbi:MAG: type II secretion system protein [Rhodocyclaceae bacterium]|nr:type II secretion system protein [Rhodocyclaceae bacterium]
MADDTATCRRCGASRARAGFAYVALLVVLAGSALGALRVAESGRMARQREAEQQLLFVGREYRQAIERYTNRDAGALRGPPKRLEDLLADKRGPQPEYHLRRLYPDPMTGSADWQVLRNAAGGIVGVRSRSRLQPLQRDGFADEETDFDQAKTYADWVFGLKPGKSASPADAADEGAASQTAPLVDAGAGA